MTAPLADPLAPIPAPIPAPTPATLAGRLREATQPLHATVERTGVMHRLLRGRLDRAGYCRLLRNLQPIYVALEAGLSRHVDHPGLAPLGCAALYRSAALADDLQALHGTAWQAEIDRVEASTRYGEHLLELSDHAPAALAAHAYVRYLGDLHGGQVLARRVAQTLGLELGLAERREDGATAARGLAFYDFGDAAAVGSRIGSFRAALGRIAGSAAQVEALVDEACDAFERHRCLFEQLDAAAAPAPAAG
jgi:heme oxygenase